MKWVRGVSKIPDIYSSVRPRRTQYVWHLVNDWRGGVEAFCDGYMSVSDSVIETPPEDADNRLCRLCSARFEHMKAKETHT